MANVSLKEQLQAMVPQLTDHLPKAPRPPQEGQARQQRQQPPRRKPLLAKPAAVSPNDKPKPKWLDYVHYGVELLKVYFPASFKPASQVLPLKKGIKEELVKKLSELPTVSTDDKACMVKSLSYYVNSPHYHKRVQEGATRVDLDGNPAGVVTAEEAAYSLERHQAKMQARDKARQMPQAEVSQTKSDD